MAISDSPESVGTSATATTMTNHTDSDLNLSIRRRSSSAAAAKTNAMEAANNSSEQRLVRDLTRGGRTCGCDCDCEDDKERIRAADDSANCEVSDKKEVRERIGKGDDRGQDFSPLKSAYRPSAPAHRTVKESPLSSDAIFRQVTTPYLNN